LMMRQSRGHEGWLMIYGSVIGRNGEARVAMAKRSSADLDFVRAGIARELQALYSDLMSEATPESIADMLKRLDPPMESDRQSA
jgi:hypothetical protein